MLGNAGMALMFLGALAASMIVGVFLLGLLAHGLLVIVEQTSAGQAEFVWPDEPITDWVWKIFYLFYLLLIVAVPALGAGAVCATLLPDKLPKAFGLFLGVGLAVWATFPVLVLSTLSGGSKLMILSAEFLAAASRKFGALLTLYLVSAPVALTAAVAGGLLLTLGGWYVLLAPVVAFLSLVYFRLVGQTGYVLFGQAKGKKKKKQKKLPVTPRTEAIEEEPAPKGPDPIDGPVEGYGVGAATATNVARAEPERVSERRMAEERQLIERPPVDPRLASVGWIEGIWLFPLHGQVSGSLMFLAVLLAIEGGLVSFMIGMAGNLG
jgi:hypothetical protein